MEDCTADAKPQRLSYAPGLDGFRAVACLAVMLFHAKLFHVTGGFLGVTMFFTLSGFLITSLLLDEVRATGGIDLREFWRRIFRIVPLLATVSLTFALWGFLAGTSLGRATMFGALANALLITNVVVSRRSMAAGVISGGWSVALEEQFYALWPPIFSWLYRQVRSERAIAFGLAILAVAVAVHRWALAPIAPWERIWFAPDTKVDGLLAGCAVALGLRCRSRLVSIYAGIVLIGLLFLVGQEQSVLVGQVAMPAAVLATALLLPFLQEHPGPLAWRPLVAVGRRSYGLYLWGGPLVYLARHSLALTGLPLVIVGIGGTFAVTEFTHRWLELPMRRRGRRPVSVDSDLADAPTTPGLNLGLAAGSGRLVGEAERPVPADEGVVVDPGTNGDFANSADHSGHEVLAAECGGGILPSRPGAG